jgi:hypothetical protein
MVAASPMQPIETNPFRVSRLQLARVTSLVYLRKAWWLMLPFPIFGLWLLMNTSDRLLQYVAIVAIFWPFSIPARSILITNKASKRLLQETVAVLDDEALYLRDSTGGGTRVPLERVTGLRRSMGLFVVELKHYVFVLVPIDAFSSLEDETAFEQRIRAAVAEAKTGSAIK